MRVPGAFMRIERKHPAGGLFRLSLPCGAALVFLVGAGRLHAQPASADRLAPTAPAANKAPAAGAADGKASGGPGADGNVSSAAPTAGTGVGPSAGVSPAPGAGPASGASPAPGAGPAPGASPAPGAGPAPGANPVPGVQASPAAVASGPNAAATPGGGSAPGEEGDEVMERVMPLQRLPPRLDPTPTWGLGVDAYAGVALLVGDESHSHVLGGFLPRLHYSYLQAGGVVEFSSQDEASWRLLGGFVGAWLPFRNWVDIDAALGLGLRTYSNRDLRYGPDGYNVDTGSLLLRLGVSDRSSGGLLGARLGAAIVTTIDFRHPSVPWVYNSEVEGKKDVVVLGATSLGGASVALMVTAGFDVAPVADPPAPPRTGSDANLYQ